MLNKILSLSTRFLIPLITAAFLLSSPGSVMASTCTTTNSTNFDVTVCIDAPASNPATLSGNTTVTGSYNSLTLRNGATLTRLEFRYTPPGGSEITLASMFGITSGSAASFTWHTDDFVDMTSGTLSVYAVTSMSGVHTDSNPASQTVTLSNSNSTAPVNTSTFTPVTPSYDGSPMVVGVAGDGASNEANPVTVGNLIEGWSPEMALYLGDVYYKGTHEEFQNFYESSFGGLKSITNPIVGNHEYIVNTSATGYMWYWNNVPNYYSYDAGGWHFIALNTNYTKIATTTSSTGTFSNGGPSGVGLVTDTTKNWRTNQWVNQTVTAGGETHYITSNSATQLTLKEAWTSVPSGVSYTVNGGKTMQQTWLDADLAANADKCIIAYNHHPRFSIGSHGSDIDQEEIWDSLVTNKATTYFVGHDHSYQRWTAMDGDAVATSSGVNQFVVGSGGHASTSITGSDAKVLSSIGGVAGYGALKLSVHKSKYDFSYYKISDGSVFDSGTVYCQGKGTMHGSVVDHTSQAVSGATVSWTGTTASGTVTGSTTTDGSGNWTQSNLPAGTYSLTFSKTGLVSTNGNAEVGGATDTAVATATLGSNVSLQGTVTDSTSAAVSGAMVWTPYGETTTDASGNYVLSDLGTKTDVPVTVTGSNVVAVMASVDLTQGTPVTQNFTPSRLVFYDDFERGDMTAWTTNNGSVAINTATTHSEDYSAEANTTGTAMNLRKTLGSTYSSLYYRTYFYVKSQASGSGLGLLAFRTSTDGAINKVYIDGTTNKICVRNEVTTTNTCSNTVPTQNAWHSIEMFTSVDSSTGEVKVWYDGSEVTSLHLTNNNLGTNNIGRVVLGEVNSGRTYDVVFDDAMVAQDPVGTLKGIAQITTHDDNGTYDLIGVPVSYSGGSTVTNSDERAFFTDVPYGTYSFTAGETGNWTPQSQNVTINSLFYNIHTFDLVDAKGSIGGTITDAAASPLSGVSVTISGGSPMNGTTQTTDASGNYMFERVTAGTYRLTFSKSGYATETRGTISYPNAADDIDEALKVSIFSDDFESNGFGNWTTNNNLSITGSSQHFGSYAAEGNTTSSAMNLRKTFASTYSTVYGRTYFNMKSIGANPVGLLWFRDANGDAIFKTYMDGTTGKLCIRNDIGSVTTCSTTLPATNTWHVLEQQLIINGTSSTHKVWLNGTEVTDLTSTTANLGNNPVGRMYLGETTTGRTYDVVFDDVLISPTRPGAAGGMISGTVTVTGGSTPISGATVSIAGKTALTDSNGDYVITDIYPANYTITSSKTNYSGDSADTIINENAETFVDFEMSVTGSVGTISGTITDPGTSSGVSGATVSYSGGSTTSDGSGNYTLSGVTVGTYTVTASKTGYITQTANNVSVTNGGTTDQDFSMPQQFMSDDFESNGFTNWTTNNNMTISSSTVHAGSYAAQANTTSLAMNLRKTLSTDQPKVYMRTYFRVASQASASSIGLVYFRDSGDVGLIKTYIDGNNGKLCIRNEFTSTNTCSNTVPTQNAWHSVELHAIVNGTSSTHKVYYDGTEETALTSTSANLGTTNIGRLIIGETNANRTYNIFFDDVLARNVYIGQ